MAPASAVPSATRSGRWARIMLVSSSPAWSPGSSKISRCWSAASFHQWTTNRRTGVLRCSSRKIHFRSLPPWPLSRTHFITPWCASESTRSAITRAEGGGVEVHGHREPHLVRLGPVGEAGRRATLAPAAWALAGEPARSPRPGSCRSRRAGGGCAARSPPGGGRPPRRAGLDLAVVGLVSLKVPGIHLTSRFGRIGRLSEVPPGTSRASVPRSGRLVRRPEIGRGRHRPSTSEGQL